MAQHGPGYACGLVGQRHGRYIRMAPYCDAGDPATEPILFVLGLRDHRACPVYQQAAQINITTLTDAE